MGIELGEVLQEVSYKVSKLEERLKSVEGAIGGLADRIKRLESLGELERRLSNLAETAKSLEDLVVQLKEVNEKLGVLLVEMAGLRDYLVESLRELRERDVQLYEVVLEKCRTNEFKM